MNPKKSKMAVRRLSVPQLFAEYTIKLCEAEKNGTLHEIDDPVYQNEAAGKARVTKMHGLTEQRLEQMTMRFNRYGEFRTDNEEIARIALRPVSLYKEE